jgi:4-amino-4-deoxychorismate lyase
MTDLRNYQLIETMRAEGRRIALLEQHIARLCHSAAALGFTLPKKDLRGAVVEALAATSETTTTRVRLLLDAQGKLSVSTAPLAPTETPVSLRLCSVPLQAQELWLQHKTTYRPLYDLAQTWLNQNPLVFDLLFFNTQDQVCEGSRSTVYVQDTSGTWLTPPLYCGLLPGVQRQVLLQHGLAREAVLTLHDLRSATQVRVSNALRGWLDARLRADVPISLQPAIYPEQGDKP